MIHVSDAWKSVQQRFILPETFVEITCGITELGVQELATATGTNEASFSAVDKIVEDNSETTPPKYLTLERNMWVLGESRKEIPGVPEKIGYVSANGPFGSVTLHLPSVRTIAIPGVTITWSTEFEEYATKFAVIAKNGNTEVATVYVDNNTEVRTIVDLEMVNYDSVTIEVYEWCLPDHRARIEQVMLGHVIIFTKKSLLSYTHDQYGNLNSGEIPKNSIEFSIDNSDGRWNPHNPTGLERFLLERQRITVRYGMDVEGAVEWIKAGTFYLSEWRTPANGIEATFIARDIFEYLLNEPYQGIRTGTLAEFVESAFEGVGVPSEFVKIVDSSLGEHTATIPDGDEYTAGEIVQMCANAACCIIRQDRHGVLYIEPLNEEFSGYIVGSALSYSHPEIVLTKPLRKVSVRYDEESEYVLDVGNSGEIQTVNNSFITTLAQASQVAEWVKNTLESRTLISGDFRADPRLDLFDVVLVESKYGYIEPVAITNITYRYSGSFRASYEGRVIGSIAPTEIGRMIVGRTVIGGGRL